MNSKIGKAEWIFILVLAGIIDILQIIIEFGGLLLLGIGPAFNEIIDPIIAAATVAYLQLRGVNILFHPKRLLWLVGTEALAEISGGLAQFWVGALILIYFDVKKEQVLGMTISKLPGALNQGGVRRPTQELPLNQNGVRPPRKPAGDNEEIPA